MYVELEPTSTTTAAWKPSLSYTSKYDASSEGQLSSAGTTAILSPACRPTPSRSSTFGAPATMRLSLTSDRCTTSTVTLRISRNLSLSLYFTHMRKPRPARAKVMLKRPSASTTAASSTTALLVQSLSSSASASVNSTSSPSLSTVPIVPTRLNERATSFTATCSPGRMSRTVSGMCSAECHISWPRTVMPTHSFL